MANYSNLKTAIENAVDWNNGDNEITGQNLLDILETIIDSLGAKYKFADVATPSSSITTPDEPLFYLAGAGTYTNFSGLSVTIPRGTLAIFYYDTAWHYTTVRTDSDAFFNVNQYLGTPSTTYTKANGRNAVPSALRSKGMIITYLTTNGWIIEQNLSTSGTWNADANWQTIGPVSVSQNSGTGKTELKIGDTPALIVDNEPEVGSNNLVKSGGVKLADKILFDENHKGHWFGQIGAEPYIIANTETGYRYLQFYVDGENLRVGDTITFYGRSLGTDYPGFITVGADGKVLHRLSTSPVSTYIYTIQSGDVWVYVSTYINVENGPYIYINNAARVIASTNSKLIKEGYVAKSDVIDDLTSSNTDCPLSANQGKALNEKIEQTSFILNNKFENNDLSIESSTAGIAEGFISRTNTTYNLADGVQSVTRGSENTSGDVLIMPFQNSANNKLYLGFYVKAKHSLYINWFGSLKTMVSVGDADVNNFRYLSAIWDGANSEVNAMFSQGNTETYEYKRIVIFNLTEIFGAGNEPDKETMDYLVDNLYNGLITEDSVSIADLWKYLCKLRQYVGIVNKTTSIARDGIGNITSITDTYENGESYSTIIERDSDGNIISTTTQTPFGDVTETLLYSDGNIIGSTTIVKL